MWWGNLLMLANIYKKHLRQGKPPSEDSPWKVVDAHKCVSALCFGIKLVKEICNQVGLGCSLLSTLHIASFSWRALFQNTSQTLGINLISKVLCSTLCLHQERNPLSAEQDLVCPWQLHLSIRRTGSDLVDGVYTKLPAHTHTPPPSWGQGFDRVFLCNYSWPGIHYIAKARFELTTVFLPHPPECQAYWHAPPYPAICLKETIIPEETKWIPTKMAD